MTLQKKGRYGNETAEGPKITVHSKLCQIDSNDKATQFGFLIQSAISVIGSGGGPITKNRFDTYIFG